MHTSTCTAELRRAVEWLYAEEATPQEALLQWRMEWQLGAQLPPEELRAAVLAAPGVRLEPRVLGSERAGRGWAALLEPEPSSFKGFADCPAAEIMVPLGLWGEAASLALRGGWPGTSVVRHERFALAAWLREGGGALGALSFGRALHLVHLLVGSGSVLGRRRGRIVPYPLSEEFEKQEHARCLAPTGLRPSEDHVASWPEFLGCLDHLLKEGCGGIAPSLLKRTFRTRFLRELSETALGHSSISSLVQDARFAATFVLDGGPDAPVLIRLRDSCT